MSSLPSLRDLKFESYDVGQNIKASKKLYKWTFFMNGNKQIVELYQSKISGKRKVMHNGSFLYEDMSYNVDFSYSFYIDKVYCNVIQVDDDRFELRIMNRAFSMLMEEERNRNNNEDYNISNIKQNYSNQNESTNTNSTSKFEFPKFLKSSNKKSVSHITEEKSTNLLNQPQQTQQPQIKKNASMNISSSSTLIKEPISNNNQTTSFINMDDIFSNNQSSKVNPNPTNNNSELFAQIDFISSNNNNQSNTFNINNNSSLLNNYNNSYQNLSINQQSNSGNHFINSPQTSNQFNPFSDFNNLNNPNPQNGWNNQTSSVSDFTVNPNNKQTVIMFDNKSDNVQKQSISNNNFNESEIKTGNSMANDNELKKKLMNNSKLVDINNLFDNKIQKIEDKSNQSTPNYAFTGTPMNAIKLDNQVPNETKFNSGNLNLQSNMNVNNNFNRFNSSGNYNPMNPGLNNQMNQMYSNQIGYGYQQNYNNNMGMVYNNQMNQNSNYNPYLNNVNSNSVNSMFK